jgi:signal transduction histidine kinase
VERANILAQKAMAANRARSESFADMAHEIRTSMNSITGFGELLVEGNLTGEQKKYIRTIQKSAENLLDLVNGILDFSKIEAGRLDIEIIRCSVKKLLGKSRIAWG